MKKIIVFGLLVVFESGFLTFSPNDTLLVLRERISDFNLKFQRSKIELLFNQSKYVPGDTALMTTLYMRAADLKPVSGREIVYCELYDRTGEMVLRNQIYVDDGSASTEWIVPSNLIPGIYLVVAYSDWMKNFDSSLFFRQDFVISGEKIQEKGNRDKSKAKIEFYPEGGVLVNGVENNLVLHMTGGDALATGVIKGNGETVSQIKFDVNGLADVKITPRANMAYRAETTSDGELREFALPSGRDDGFAIRVSADQRQVVIEPGANMKSSAQQYFLTLTGKRGLEFSIQLEFDGGKSQAVDFPSDLDRGVLQLTIIDNAYKVWNERTLFIGDKKNYKIDFRQSGKIFSTRVPVKIDMAVKDESGNPVEGKYAVRVTQQALFQDSLEIARIKLSTQLYSDIGATFRLSGDVENTVINRYLVTQTAPWLPWAKIFSGAPITPAFAVKKSISLSGNAFYAATQKPVPDSTLVIFFLRKKSLGYEAMADKKGNFKIPVLYDFTGTDQVFYTATYKGKDLYGVSLKLNQQDSNFVFKAAPAFKTEKDDAYGLYSAQRKMIDASFNYFSAPTTVKDSTIDLNAAVEKKLQGADYVLKISDYNIFPNMPDLIREVLRAVDYRKSHGRDVVRVYTSDRLPDNSRGPLYVIDGVVTKNTATFINLTPSDIITIKIVRNAAKLIKLGSLGANGVILVRTKQMRKIVEENTFPLTGMSPGFDGARRNATVTSIEKDRQIPDVRANLYFNSDGVLDRAGKAEISFQTSDDVGNYTVHLEGVSDSGVPFSADETVSIKYEPQP